MKKLLTAILIVLSIYGCTTEENAGVANEKTFIRYLGTEDNNEAILALEDETGFGLLSNSDVVDNLGTRKRIKFIHTDRFGHLQWERTYLGNGEQTSSASSITASSFIVTPQDGAINPGYLIIGDRIKSNGITGAFLMRIQADGSFLEADSIALFSTVPGVSLHGRAVERDPSDGNYIVLGTLTSASPLQRDMFTAKINKADLSVMWQVEYGAGFSSTINKIYVNADQTLVWGGSVLNDVRLVKVPMGTASVINGANEGDPQTTQQANDFCKIIGGWMFTGYTSQGPTDQDILLMSVTSEVKTKPIGTVGVNERGVSIAPTDDGGYVVLGEVDTQLRAEDLVVMKCTIAGDPIWQENYGGADRQEAASIRQISDGSYLVFATTYFVNEKKLMLLKLNKNGKL